MQAFRRFLHSLLDVDAQQRLDEDYLAHSSDIADLERRMLELEMDHHGAFPARFDAHDAIADHGRPRW